MIYPGSQSKSIKEAFAANKMSEADSVAKASRSFTISWSNLTYKVKMSTLDKMINKMRGVEYTSASRTVLRGLHGSFQSGQLTALMGPSGAGKSTLLECIAGMRQKGLSADIKLHRREKVSIGFIPQEDHLYELLTVREALTYASELQNSRKINGKSRPHLTSDNHRLIVDNLLSELHLDICSGTKIGRISGGQRKRVSIGQELVARPDILIMDEPTSGLDSSTCFQLMDMLYQLVTQSSEPIAIVMTIHQPSAKVFNMFHKVYMLSRLGRFVYEGEPEGVVQALSTVDIACSQFYNPADLLVEVASGDFGTEVLQEMANNVENLRSKQSSDRPVTTAVAASLTSDLHKSLIRPVAPFWRHFFILLVRQSVVMIRDPLLGALRFIFAFNIALTLGLLYVGKGSADGCLPDIGNRQGLDEISEIQILIEEKVRTTFDNVGSLYFLLLYSCLANLMPMAVAIPMEIKIFAKERYNGWYKTSSYYLAKGFAEVPFILGTNLIVVTGHFWFTGQPWDRYWSALAVYFMVSMVAQTHGILCGAFLMNNVVASVFTAPNTAVPMILLSGFFIRCTAMPVFFEFLSNLSYLRFGFEGFMVAIFGHNRCQQELTNKMRDARQKLGLFLSTMFRMARVTLAEEAEEEEDPYLRNQTAGLVQNIVQAFGGQYYNEDNVSGAMMVYSLDDDNYLKAMLSLTAIFLIARIVTYFILKWRSNLQQ